MARKHVAVSKLADYAADPAGFEARRGGVKSRKAARAGTRHHDNLGRSNGLRKLILVVAVVVVGYVVVRLLF